MPLVCVLLRLSEPRRPLRQRVSSPLWLWFWNPRGGQNQSRAVRSGFWRDGLSSLLPLGRNLLLVQELVIFVVVAFGGEVLLVRRSRGRDQRRHLCWFLTGIV